MASLKWKSNTQPNILLNHIKENLTISKEGRVSRPLEIEFHIDALLSKVKHNFQLSRSILYTLFEESIYESYRRNRLTDKSFLLEQFNARCSKIYSNNHKFVLVTSLNLKTNNIPKRRQVLCCYISFFKHIPKKYIKKREVLIKKYDLEGLPRDEEYLKVCISVSAPNPLEAYERGMKALDLLRGSWQINFKKSMNFLSSGAEKYLTDSIVKVGKIHTVHHSGGRVATETIWIEDNFKPLPPVRLKNKSKFELQCTNLLSGIRRSPFRQHLESSIVYYIQALDQVEHGYRFLKLWTVVEFLLVADSTKELSRKLSFMYKDRDVIKEVVTSLREERNINSHKGGEIGNIEMKNYLMVLFIEQALRFLIGNHFGFQKLAEVLEFLGQPTELDEVNKKLKLLKKVSLYIQEAK